jgi:hypothetical protein
MVAAYNMLTNPMQTPDVEQIDKNCKQQGAQCI